ncbi:tripartite motif-containing protein 2-like, partial [Saccoglossus kowalevskii]
MASETEVAQALDEITEDFLTCCICFEHYRQPKVLPCLHTFCEQCLITLANKTDLDFKCPTCSTPCDLGEKEIAGLKGNFFISSLLHEMKKRSKSLSKTASTRSHGLCSIHYGNELRYFCKTCQVPTCTECTIVTHRMPEHIHITIKEAVDECHSYLVESVKILEDRKDVLSKGMRKMTELRSILDDNFTKEKAAVGGASEHMSKAV